MSDEQERWQSKICGCGRLVRYNVPPTLGHYSCNKFSRCKQHKMSSVQRERVESCKRGLELEERALGYHQCPDNDYMVVGPGDPEMEGCVCDIDGLREDAYNELYVEQLGVKP